MCWVSTVRIASCMVHISRSKVLGLLTFQNDFIHTEIIYPIAFIVNEIIYLFVFTGKEII